MSVQESPPPDSDSDGVLEFALRRWQALDRGWKACFLGVAIVLENLAGIAP